jgi:hypothetical protein
MSSTNALEWRSMGDFVLVTFKFHPDHLTGHHFLPYHLHYHIHPDQVQDQPTTEPLK